MDRQPVFPVPTEACPRIRVCAVPWEDRETICPSGRHVDATDFGQTVTGLSAGVEIEICFTDSRCLRMQSVEKDGDQAPVSRIP